MWEPRVTSGTLRSCRTAKLAGPGQITFAIMAACKMVHRFLLPANGVLIPAQSVRGHILTDVPNCEYCHFLVTWDLSEVMSQYSSHVLS